MQKKNDQTTDSNIDDIIALIKSLGGAKTVYNYLQSKNIIINIDSIYKWKTNGIPYRYRSHIKELANNKNIIISNKIFPDISTSSSINTEIISNSNKVKDNNSRINIKHNRIFMYVTLLVFAILILQFYYFQYEYKILKNEVVKLENIISTVPVKNYDIELEDLKKLIDKKNSYNKSNSINISDNLKSININRKKIIKIESIIQGLLNNNINFSNSKQENSSKLLISLILIKYNIKFFNPKISNIELINNYFDKIDTPSDISLAIDNLNNLSTIKLKSHVQLIKEFASILKEIEKNKASKANNSFSFSKYFKKIIKINKINYNSFTNKRDIYSNIIENLNIYNYSLIIYELSNINNSHTFSLWVNDIKNIKTLNNSLDTIINWLIHKG